MLCFLLIPLYPASGMSRHYRPSRLYHHHHHYRNYHGDEAVFWALGGLILGSVIVAAALQPPPSRDVGYVRAQAPIYTYPPAVPSGMCRWERFVLDNYGNMVLDKYGQPIKQYTLGSCQYPPE